MTGWNFCRQVLTATLTVLCRGRVDRAGNCRDPVGMPKTFGVNRSPLGLRFASIMGFSRCAEGNGTGGNAPRLA